MGRITPSETRARIYRLALEGLTGTAISKAVGISRQAVSKHILALVSDGYLRPLGSRSRPRIYEGTSKPLPELSTLDHRGWSPTVRAHRTGRHFKVTHRPKRSWPWLWDNYWSRSGVDYYIVRDIEISTQEGQIRAKAVRYIQGPRSSSLTIWVEDEALSDGFQVLAHEDTATETAILVANEIARRTGLRIALPEVIQPTEYAIAAPSNVVDAALEEDLKAKDVHFDRSKGAGEIETTDRDIAITWLHLPEELRILREGLREVKETVEALGEYAKGNNETVLEISKAIQTLDKRTRFLEDPVKIVEDPPEEMYQ